MLLSQPDPPQDPRLIGPDAPEWPREAFAALDAHPDPDVFAPTRLWVRGEASLAALTARSVTMEGSRACSGHAEYVAADLGYGLAEHGITVVSGGGFGCAAAALRGALARDGRVVVVLPSGIAVDHPMTHANLLRGVVAKGGLIISPHPPNTPPSRATFAQRTGLLAALTGGSVIVETGLRSGSRLLARRAQELGRPAMAVPGPVTATASDGCHDLIRNGLATLVTSAAEILHDTGLTGPSPDITATSSQA